jgi:hypothetical protein
MVYYFISRHLLKLLLMRTPERLEEVRGLSSSRKSNDVVQSKYFPTPHRVQENPEALHTFFHDNPVLIS